MKIEYAPPSLVERGAIRVELTEDRDAEIAHATLDACYKVGRIPVAHHADSDFGEAILDAWGQAQELRRYPEGHALEASADTVVAWALCTAFVSNTNPEEAHDAIHDAADLWSAVVTALIERTSRSALNTATHPTQEVPDDPWDEEATDDIDDRLVTFSEGDE